MMNAIQMKKTAFGVIVAFLAGASAAQPFKNGDRACIFGDSVTHHGYYTSQIQAFYYTRYPKADIHIWNCGVGGETAGEALTRFGADIVTRKPTFISFAFGANDVCVMGYATNASSWAVEGRKQALKEFSKNVRTFAELFARRTPQAEIMWCTPPAWDDALEFDPPREFYRGVTAGEGKLADFITAFAKERKQGYLDFFNPLVEYNRKLHAKNPRHSLAPDRIHPREPGGLFMASLFLRAQGVSGTVSDTIIDAGAAKALRTVNGKVEALAKTPAGLAFTLTENALPFPLEPLARGVADDIGFYRNLNREYLYFRNLEPGDWELRIDGRHVCVLNADEWARGLNLATCTNTPMMAQAREVAALNQEKRLKEGKVRSLWVARTVAFRRLKWQMPMSEQDYDDGRLAEAFIAGFMNAKAAKHNDLGMYSEFAKDWSKRNRMEDEIEALHRKIRGMNQPKAHRFELVRAGAWAKPELVAEVESGRRKEAKVSWWGFDSEDSTRFLRAAIESKAAKLVLDQQAGPWVTRPLVLRSEISLLIPEGVELLAKRGEYRGMADSMLTLNCCTNVTISGGGTIRMWFDDYVDRRLYAWSEWRHAILMRDSENVLIEKLRVVDSGGDGLYVGRSRTGINHNITVRDVVFSRNNRQGISVISADGLLIERCTLENTCGTPPMAGIDFEPNAADEMLCNIIMRDCVARGNTGAGFDFSVFQLSADSRPISITLENCRSEGNLRPTHINRSRSALTDFRGRLLFRNCVFNDADPTREVFSGKDGPNSLEVTFENCRAADPAKGGAITPMLADCGWGRQLPPSWPDGTPILLPALRLEQLERAVIHDAKPGEVVKLPLAHFRGKSDFLVYAAQPGELHFVCACRRIGKTPFSKCSVEVRDLAGKLVASPVAPTEFEKDTPFAFKVPAKGFYRMSVAAGKSHAMRFISADAPIAAIKNQRGRVPEWNGGVGEAYIYVPNGCRRFGLMPAGGGGAEKLRVKLFDPTGREVWDEDNISDNGKWFSGDKPPAGIWKFVSLRPSLGCLDDYDFSLMELPLIIFLSPEKTWELPQAN